MLHTHALRSHAKAKDAEQQPKRDTIARPVRRLMRLVAFFCVVFVRSLASDALQYAFIHATDTMDPLWMVDFLDIAFHIHITQTNPREGARAFALNATAYCSICVFVQYCIQEPADTCNISIWFGAGDGWKFD